MWHWSVIVDCLILDKFTASSIQTQSRSITIISKMSYLFCYIWYRQKLGIFENEMLLLTLQTYKQYCGCGNLRRYFFMIIIIWSFERKNNGNASQNCLNLLMFQVFKSYENFRIRATSNISGPKKSHPDKKGSVISSSLLSSFLKSFTW